MKLLTRLFLSAALLSAPAYVFANSHTTTINTNQYKTEDRHLSGFNAVDLEGSFDVFLTQGSTESVRVEAPEDVIHRILTEVHDGVLKIYNRHDVGFHWGDWFGSHHKKIAVYVTVKDINSINVSGSGDISFKEGITANTLKIRVSGSGDMVGKVNVKTLESSVSGSGDVKLSGSADNSTVSVVGSGDFTARNLVTINTAVRVSGSGDVDINASNKVEASVSGSGDVHYNRGVKSVSASKSGSGDIERY